jgi:hypothetical protein
MNHLPQRKNMAAAIIEPQKHSALATQARFAA